MKYVVRDRNGEESYSEESKVVKFLYSTIVGRVIVKIISFPFISKIIGWILNRKISKIKIKSFVKKNNIDLSVYEEKDYKSFNDFFIRKRKSIDIEMNKDIFISPCDAKCSYYEIDLDSKFLIKGSYYSIKDLLGGNSIYKKYNGGVLLVLRLCANDYHRYIYLDNGKKQENIFIKGKLNTVRPIVYKHFNIFKENSREYTVLHTENFGDVVQVEVGAICVGKINNFHNNYEFKRAEEKGCFEFGGSTICLLIEKGKVIIDNDIVVNSKEMVETLVKIGSRIGKKL